MTEPDLLPFLLSLSSAFLTCLGVWGLMAWRIRSIRRTLHSKEQDLIAQTLRAQRVVEVERTLEQAQATILDLTRHNATLKESLHQQHVHAEQAQRSLEEMHQKMTQTFQALSYEALQQNTRHFLETTQAHLNQWHEATTQHINTKHEAFSELVRPLKEGLTQFDTKIADLEKHRQSAYDVLRHQVQELIHTQKDLKQETHKLVSALKAPTTRGRWGEIQLRRVVEMAGMLSHCDFMEQKGGVTPAGNLLRPDLIIQLPGQKHLVVDAKTPLHSYLQALEAPDEATRIECLKHHARHVRAHIQSLSERQYWNQFKPTPEFVILFLPGEAFFSAALEHDPSLIEMGVEQKVILATPTTLIALLRAVAYGWQQEHLTHNIEAVGNLGRELYKRVQDMGKCLAKMGRQLGGAVEAYNKLVGNVEHRVLVTARRFQSLEHEASASPALETLTPLESTPKTLQAPEWDVDEAV